MNRYLLSALCFCSNAGGECHGRRARYVSRCGWEVRTPAEVGLDVAKLQEFSASVGGGRHRARWVHGLHLGRSERSQPHARRGRPPPRPSFPRCCSSRSTKDG